MADQMQFVALTELVEQFDKRIEWLRQDVHDKYSLGLYHGAATDKELISEIPAVDAAPVVHGRWITEYWLSGYIRSRTCSECGEGPKDSYKPGNYCSNCGAKMDLEEK